MPPVPRACAFVWSEYCFQAEFVFALSSSSGETVDRVDRTGQFHPGLSCWDSIIDIVELSRMCLKPAIEPFAGARRIFLALRTWHICVIYSGKGKGDRREQRWFAELPAQHAIARDVPEHSPTRQESMAGVQSLAIDSHFLLNSLSPSPSLNFSLCTRTYSHSHQSITSNCLNLHLLRPKYTKTDIFRHRQPRCKPDPRFTSLHTADDSGYRWRRWRIKGRR